MKKFMTDIKTLAALLIAGAAFTACSSSDDNIIDEQPVNPAQKTYTLTVNASKGDGATTRALDLTGKTLTASWATTERVYVKKGSDWATGSLQPDADGTTATLKGSLSDITIEASDNLTLQFPKSGDITYAGQLGTLADIQANFDWATANVEVESVSPSGNINPKAATTTFTNQQAIIKFTLKDKANDAAISPSALTVDDGTSTVSLTSISTDTYTANGGDGVLYVAFPATGSPETVTLTATVGDDTYTYETATTKTFRNGQYYDITVKMTKQAPASTPLDNTTTAWTAGTYVVPAGGLTYGDAITVSGDVTLVLTDGTTLTANNGISVASDATLTIEGTGTMNVKGSNGNTSSTTGGSGTIILTSGTLTATGGNGSNVGDDCYGDHGGAGGAAINGSVIVNGGTLTATGGNGGNVGNLSEDSSGGAGGAAIGGSLTINAGTVTTTNGAAGSVGFGTEGCSGGAAGLAVAGTVTDNR